MTTILSKSSHFNNIKESLDNVLGRIKPNSFTSTAEVIPTSFKSNPLPGAKSSDTSPTSEYLSREIFWCKVPIRVLKDPEISNAAAEICVVANWLRTQGRTTLEGSEIKQYLNMDADTLTRLSPFLEKKELLSLKCTKLGCKSRWTIQFLDKWIEEEKGVKYVGYFKELRDSPFLTTKQILFFGFLWTLIKEKNSHFITNKRMAEMLGWSEAKVSRYLTAVRRKGLVGVHYFHHHTLNGIRRTRCWSIAQDLFGKRNKRQSWLEWTKAKANDRKSEMQKKNNNKYIYKPLNKEAKHSQEKKKRETSEGFILSLVKKKFENDPKKLENPYRFLKFCEELEDLCVGIPRRIRKNRPNAEILKNVLSETVCEILERNWGEEGRNHWQTLETEVLKPRIEKLNYKKRKHNIYYQTLILY